VYISGRTRQQREAQEAELYEQIGRLKVDLEWLKKLPVTVEARRAIIEIALPEISVRRQCELIKLNRSTYYCQPATESPLNLLLLRLIDLQYTEAPFYGYLKMTQHVRRSGCPVHSTCLPLLSARGEQQDQHGRPRPVGGQHLRGAALAYSSAPLRLDTKSAVLTNTILQHPAEQAAGSQTRPGSGSPTMSGCACA